MARKQNIGIRVRQMQLGVTSVDVAFRSGIHPSSYSRILNGWMTPTEEQKVRIAAVLKCSPEEIFGEADYAAQSA